MKVLVTGANGQLGWDMIIELKKRGHEPFATDILDNYEQDCEYIKLDITDEKAVYEAIAEVKPNAVVHCAAWTAVDVAEDEKNKTKVYAVNVLGTQYIAEACKKTGCKMIYISTAYVFNGEGTEPWEPTVRTSLRSITTARQSLRVSLRSDVRSRNNIVRTSWVLGIRENNFVKTMLLLSETHSEVHVVNNQIDTPTYTPDLERLLVDMC